MRDARREFVTKADMDCAIGALIMEMVQAAESAEPELRGGMKDLASRVRRQALSSIGIRNQYFRDDHLWVGAGMTIPAKLTFSA